jgi:hypothetical protein
MSCVLCLGETFLTFQRYLATSFLRNGYSRTPESSITTAFLQNIGFGGPATQRGTQRSRTPKIDALVTKNQELL